MAVNNLTKTFVIIIWWDNTFRHRNLNHWMELLFSLFFLKCAKLGVNKFVNVEKVERKFSGKSFFHVAHRKEILIYAFPEKELRVFSPNFHINVPVSDIYIYSHVRPTYFPAAE
jgi:hypothetical protein